MIFDLEKASEHEFQKADVCIVGAGAAGIALAVELLRLGKQVLLLEGGGREIEERSQEPYRSEVIGLRHNGIHTGRYRTYGGTTTMWGGQILELDETDFDIRSWVPGSGWPFPKSTLHRYYQRALELAGVDQAILRDCDVWREIGVDEPPMGTELIPYFSRWCPEPNFTRIHRNLLENHGSLTVYLHANACSLVLQADGETVSGIRCRTLTGKEAFFAAKRYVLCLGGIETSRFLLQPMENGRAPWHRSGLVGKYYQDHIDCNCAEIKEVDTRRFHQYFDNVFSKGYKYHPKVKLAPTLQERHQVLSIAGTMTFSSEIDQTLGRLKQTAKHVLRGRLGKVKPTDLLHMGANLPILAKQIYRYKQQHRIYNPPSAKIQLRVHCEQEPFSQSSITLAEDRDSLGLFRARLDWKVSPLEMKTIRLYAETMRERFTAMNLARIEIDPELYSSDGSFQSKLDDSNHHMGGTRMSDSVKTGVVDPNLRLYGVPNCYVCSCSVFPSSGFSNPTHTLLALAVRLAEHLSSLPD